MERSESIKELATALAKAQGEIKGALKDSENPFFKSKYADLSSVVEAIKPAHKFGLSFVQPVHSVDGHASIETIILHESGEWLSCGCVTVPVLKQDAQSYGSALMYCRRYSLSAAFGVAPEDDDGNDASTSPTQQAQPKPAEQAKQTAPKQEPSKADPNAAIGVERAKRLESAILTTGAAPAHLKNAIPVHCNGKVTLAELTEVEGAKLLAHFKEKAAQKGKPANDSEQTAFDAAHSLESALSDDATDLGDIFDALHKHSTFDGDTVYVERWAGCKTRDEGKAVLRQMRDLLIGKQETA